MSCEFRSTETRQRSRTKVLTLVAVAFVNARASGQFGELVNKTNEIWISKVNSWRDHWNQYWPFGGVSTEVLPTHGIFPSQVRSSMSHSMESIFMYFLWVRDDSKHTNQTPRSFCLEQTILKWSSYRNAEALPRTDSSRAITDPQTGLNWDQQYSSYLLWWICKKILCKTFSGG